MEEDAVAIGLDLHYFWSLTPKQWAKHVKAFNQREKRRLEEKDLFNFLLGKYVMYAFNNPKRYPSKPFTENTDLKPMTDEEMERQARRNTIIMGGVIVDS